MTKNQLKSLFSSDTPIFSGAPFDARQRASLATVQKIIGATAKEYPGVAQQPAPDTYRIYAAVDLGSVIGRIFNGPRNSYLLGWPVPARRLSGAILAKAFRPEVGTALGYGNVPYSI